MNKNLIAPWVRRFLVEYIVIERNLSQNTQRSYRDTFAQLMPFISKREKTQIDQINIEHLTPDSIREFFEYIQRERKCSVVTCNQRLAAVHGLAQFIAWRSPENVAWASQIGSVPFKKTVKTEVGYLEKSEMTAILNAPNLATKQGARDHAVLLFMYNTGARASEVGLAVGNVDLTYTKAAKILGKGGKVRHCPLWEQTIAALKPLTEGRVPTEALFINRRRQSLTRYGVHTLVERYVKKAAEKCPSLKDKQISPHVIRHTTAVHLLRSGVDINTIRAWLGHVSIDTTNIYAEVDLEMKAKALAMCKINDAREPSQKRARWKESPDLMNFLSSL
jgi:site-specific recombinase XerD